MGTDPRELVGRWTLRRRLADRAAGQCGRAIGQLTITPDLAWQETGELHWGGRVLPFARTMAFAERAGEWWVTFADGRPFHPWRLGTPVEHPCAADIYCGRVELAADRLRVLWDVTGPAKHQRILTEYRRRATRE
jgi:hypothetical protein